MKGPGLRTALDVRRLWVCPQCGRKLKLPGHIVSRRCDCGDAFMKLVEEKPTPRPHRPIEDPAIAPAPEEVEQSAPQPTAEREAEPTLVVPDAIPPAATTLEPVSSNDAAPEPAAPSEAGDTTEPAPETTASEPATPAADAKPPGDAAATGKSDDSGDTDERRGKKKRRRKRRRKGRGK